MSQDKDPSYNNNGTTGRIYYPDDDGDSPTSPARAPLLSVTSRVKSIIEDGGEGEGQVTLTNRSLFTQLDVLTHCSDGQTGWKEMARWMKYQELVESGDRWSKPHVPTGSMHSINEIRRLLSDGFMALGLGLDSPSAGARYIAEAVSETLRSNEKSKLTERECQLIIETILRPHKHMHRKSGKSHDEGTHNPAHSHSSEEGESDKKKSLLRRRSGEGKDIAASYHKYPVGAKPDNLKKYKPNKKLTKKLPKDCEAANILVGQVDYLTETVYALCRFDPARKMADLTEVDFPTRFIFVILGPRHTSNIWELTELGRAMGSFLNDKVFCEVAYKARSRQDLLDAIDEFIDDLTILPPSIWDSNTRLEPPSHTRSMDKIALRLEEAERVKGIPTEAPQEEGASEDPSLIRTGRICGGLIFDIKHRYRHYLTDITDGIHLQCLASFVFLFFACISPIVTFGGLMGEATNNYMGTMEMLLSGAICGVIYALFAGQPLTIIGATGPLLVFESILYRICNENEIDFLSLRLWVGVWVTGILIIMVVFDLSALVRYITRYTEESFSILISAIFLYEAFNKLFDIQAAYLVHTGVIRQDPSMHCFCVPEINATQDPFDNQTEKFLSNWRESYKEECITLERRLIVQTGCISEDQCKVKGGNLTGSACDIHRITQSVPDVFFLSVILCFGTYALAMAYKNFRASPYLPGKIRSTVADFAVFLSIITWTGIDYFMGLDTPKLNVPEKFATTREDRTWFINPGAVTYIWIIPATIIPAILATILIFLDQQITAVIVNRKEHKMKKGHGYHLDLMVLSVLVLICSFLGLPWFVAATVRSLTHVKSLFRYSEVKIPGEKPQMIGIRIPVLLTSRLLFEIFLILEQRVTGVMIHLFIGLSTLLTGMLRIVPMPVLYGVFLYMGLTSLDGVQFVDRILIMFMPVKHQPDYVYLRHVRTYRVHIFTAIQILTFAGMWAVKQTKQIAIGFPIMLLVLIIVRKLMDFIFTQTELYWLDHLLPEEYRRQEEDRKKALGMGDEMDGVFTENKSPIYRKSVEAYG